MSETKTYSGKIRKLEFPLGMDLTEKIKYFHSNYAELEDFESYNDDDDDDDLKSCFYKTFWSEPSQYIIIGDDIYKTLEYKCLDVSSIFEGSRNSDGSIDFLVSYWNDCVGFDEAIKEVLEKV